MSNMHEEDTMMIAKFQLDARFGHKDEVLALMRSWSDKFGSKVGWTDDKVRMTTASVGAPESRIVLEVKVDDLAALNQAFDEIATMDGHAEWGKKLEPHMVSGSNRWEVYRVLD
jgi:hypothetical protein